ncbi:Zinc-finger homeodomain protein 6 [Linum perenne]
MEDRGRLSDQGARSRIDRLRLPLDLQPDDDDDDNHRSGLQQQPTTSSPPTPIPIPIPLITVRYKECMKNHAAASGRHVVDGCGEFMPRADDDSPAALRCAACDCHRSFHRQEIDMPPPIPPPPIPSFATMQRLPLPAPPVMMMSFGGGGGGGGGSSAAAESSSEDLNTTMWESKKRHRTKLSKEQKEMMADFAERIGWRILKQDESEMDRFCSEIGVKSKVFRVWMHNNKQAMKRK